MTPIRTIKFPLRFSVILILTAVFFGCGNKMTGAHQVCGADACYEVEVAERAAEWQRGLMFRKELPASKGMLFIFPQLQRHSFWMKNTLISLDIIWMDASRRVVHIEENVPPCKRDPCHSYTPAQPALYVLELNAGRVELDGIKTGDQFDFRLDIDSL